VAFEIARVRTRIRERQKVSAWRGKLRTEDFDSVIRDRECDTRAPYPERIPGPNGGTLIARRRERGG